MKRLGKVVVLSLLAGSLMLSACARRHACKQADTVPSYVQTGK